MLPLYPDQIMDQCQALQDLYFKGIKAFFSASVKIYDDTYEKASKAPYMVSIQRVVQSNYYINTDDPGEAEIKAMEQFKIDPNQSVAQVALRRFVYKKNDSDGYDLITGIREK